MSSFCTAKATHIFSAKKIQHICVSLDVNFNESLTNDVVSFEQLGPGKILKTQSEIDSRGLVDYTYPIWQRELYSLPSQNNKEHNTNEDDDDACHNSAN